MSVQAFHISESLNVLHENISQIVQVREWAEHMGYANTKKFSRRFLRHYSVRPCKILIAMRLKSIYEDLKTRDDTNFSIARSHGLPDEKGLNKFVNYHLDCPPSQLKTMPEEEFSRRLEKLGSKVR